MEEEAKNIYKPKRGNLNLIIWLNRLKLKIKGVRISIALK
jgi:hypothetical protein